MKKKGVIILTIFLMILLGVMLFLNEQQENRQAIHMKRLRKEAQPYEQEITAIRSELERLENGIKRVPEVSGGIIGFVPTSVDDIFTIKALTVGYEFTPLIILDCSMDETILRDIANQAVGGNCDLILAGMDLDEEVLKKADSIRAILPEYGYEKEVSFFLRYTCDTAENRKLLREHGYWNLVRYDMFLNFGIDDFDVPYISYGFLESTNPNYSYVSQIIDSHTYSVMTFDFSDINSGINGESVVREFLKIVNDQVSKGELLYMNISEVFHAVVKGEKSYQEQREEFEQYKIEKQKRIEELEEIVSEIYSQWDEYER